MRPDIDTPHPELPKDAVWAQTREGLIKTDRVYANGAIKHGQFKPEDIQEWFSYNSTWRPGCALFINCICVYRAGFDDEKIRQTITKLKQTT